MNIVEKVYVCGICGSTEESKETSLCLICNSDYWVQSEDFDNPELKEYVEKAAKNLNLTVEELRLRCKES